MSRVLLFLIGALCLRSANAQSCTVSNADKIDCGEVGTTQQSCEAKSCCWAEEESNSKTPWCFAPSINVGYSLSDMKQTTTGFKGTLNLLGNGTQTYGPDLPTLSLEVVFETVDTFRLRVTDEGKTRWEVPSSILPRPAPGDVPPLTPDQLNYHFAFTSSPFTFRVTRKSDGRDLFRTDSPFVFKDQYIELSTATDPQARTFGLGESTRLEQALVPGSTYTMWAADIPAAAFYKNLYGSFPYYLQLHPDGSTHGALLLSSNGMDVKLLQDSLTFRTIGGIIDLYVFAGPSPDAVTKQYTALVGRPAMQPYWALGFHNCKYGYTSVGEVEEVVEKYRSAGIPLETQWMDIDYMQAYRDFTWSSSSFPQQEVAAFVDRLHGQGQRFVPIVDPGIMVLPSYPPYDQGIQEDIFLKDLSGKEAYLGQVWPGPVYFPDFLHPKTQHYWTQLIASFHASVAIDGLWIDMNEISNFCNDDGAGQVCSSGSGSKCPSGDVATQTTCCLSCTTTDPKNSLDFPPYRIANQQGNGNLGAKTVPPSSLAYNNTSSYDAHNLYGLTEQIATHAALASVRGARPFLLSRSSFPSTGAHSAKWTGDNFASWDDLRSSIISVLDFNLFGVPMVGADICGFLGDSNEELCARWAQLGAFYPFSRDHSALGTAPQELYLWPSVSATAKTYLSLRLQLLPYIYTALYHTHREGGALARGVWYEHPEEAGGFAVVEQFYLGPSLLVSPCLHQGSTSVDAYFPRGMWYPLTGPSLSGTEGGDIDATSAPAYHSLPTPLTSTNLHIRGGAIIPLHTDANALTTEESKKSPLLLLVCLSAQNEASGSLYVDDGEQISLSSFLLASFSAYGGAAQGSLSAALESDSFPAPPRVSVITIRARTTSSTSTSTSSSPVPVTASVNGVAVAADQIVKGGSEGAFSIVGIDVAIGGLKVTWG